MADELERVKTCLLACAPALEAAAMRRLDGERDELLPRLAEDLAKHFETVVPGLGLAAKAVFGKSAVNRLLDRQLAQEASEAERRRFVADVRDATELLIADAVLHLTRTAVRTSEETQRRVERARAEAQHGTATLLAAVEALVSEVRTAPRGVGPRPPSRGRVKPRGELPFVGRAAELQALDALVEGPPGFLAALVGAPGVGKTELAHELARRHATRYPGGAFPIAMRPGADAPEDLAALARTTPGREGLAALPLADQCRAALAALGPERTLLIFDAAPSERAVEDWLPAHGSGCDVLVTSTQTEWTSRFVSVRVDGLDAAQGRQLVGALGGAEVDARFGEALVRNAGGVTIQLCAATRAVARAMRHGRPPPDPAAFFAGETRESFRGVWRLMEADVRALLELAVWFDTQHVREDLLAGHLAAQLGWDGARVEAAIIDACDYAVLRSDACDYAVLRSAGDGELRIHDLFARFVRAERAADPALPPASLDAHVEAFVRAAAAFDDRPGDADLRRGVLAFPVAPAIWREDAALSRRVRGGAAAVGRALRKLGLFRDAAGWLEVAVEEADGDLARAHLTHEVGECLWHVRELEDSRRWLLEARRLKAPLGPEARIGDTLFMLGEYFWSRGHMPGAEQHYVAAVAVHRRDAQAAAIDHVALGTSLHAVGNVYLLGDDQIAVEERARRALPLFEEALSEKQKGYADGALDPESLGATLHQLGECQFALDDDAAALTYFQRAVREGERGDRWHRVDLDSVGKSMSKAGLCQMNLGDLEAAERTFHRALELKAAGDVYGRKDAESIGRTLANLAELRELQGRFSEAARAMREAAESAAKGNVQGTVDHALVHQYQRRAAQLEARARAGGEPDA